MSPPTPANGGWPSPRGEVPAILTVRPNPPVHPSPLDPQPSEVRTALPLPICHVGYVFIAQSDTPDGPLFFCTCTRAAITNCLEENLAKQRVRAAKVPQPQNRYGFIVDHSFPRVLGDRLWAEKIPNAEVLSRLKFAENICHRCNRAVPPFEIMEGRSYFHRVFRRLIYRDHYDLGFDCVGRPLAHVKTPTQTELLPTEYPSLIRRQQDLHRQQQAAPPFSLLNRETWAEHFRLHRETREADKAILTIHDRVTGFVVERLRAHYGFPAFKEWLQRESVLALSVQLICRGREMQRHARPDFLQGLELDLWVPELRLGIEFQGAQHTRAFDYLGGEEALQRTQERDRRKAKLCHAAGVRLVYFDETDDLNESAVAQRLNLDLPA